MRRSVVLCFPIFIVLRSSAQETVPRDTIPSFELEEILVTASRGGGEILTSPMAISLVTAKDFSTSRRAGLNDPLTGLPGVLVQSRAGGQDIRLTVRGFGARGNGDRSNAATIRGIKVMVDGIPETEPDGRTALDLIDLGAIDRVEVIRSNVSTLFGNASGGVVHFSTISRFEAPFLTADNILGSYGLRRTSLNFGAPFGSSKIFISATNGEFEGWRQNSATGASSIRANLTSTLNPSTRLHVSSVIAANHFEIPGALTESEYEADPARANPSYLMRHERRKNKLGRLALQLSTSFDMHHSIEVLGFVNPKILERSERNTFRNFNRYHIGGGASYQFQAETGSILKKFSAGLDEAYQDGTILFYNLLNGERGDSLRSNQREGAETLGIFGQAELRLTDDINLLLGARFNLQRYIAESYAAGSKSTTQRDDLSFRHWTPRVALLFRFAENHSAYFNFAGGLEMPAFNEIDPPNTLPTVALNPFLEPMSSTTFEAGVKGIAAFSASLLRSFSYSVAAYSILVRNEIVPYNGGAWYFSAGRSQRVGGEAGVRADFTGGLSFRSAYTHLRARYVSYVNDLGDFSHKIVPGIPSDVLSSQIRYEAEWGARLEAGLEHIGRHFADDANLLSVPSSWIWNVSGGYELSLAPVNISVYAGIQNVSDTKYIASSFINPTGSPGSAAYIEPGLPRNFYFGLNAHIVW